MRAFAWIALLGLIAGCKSSTTGHARGIDERSTASSTGSPAPVPGPAPPRQPAANTGLATYSDPDTGVSFRYPSVWKSTSGDKGYLASALGVPFLHHHATFAFFTPGSSYQHTDLRGISFSFATGAGESLLSCGQEFAAADAALHVTNQVSINGIPFVERSHSDAGMCHDLNSLVDVTYAHHRCLAFSRDVNTICPGVEPGERAITPEERHTLQQHLDEVMQSVRITQ